MHSDIGVLVNSRGETASPYEEGIIKVYRKRKGQWTVIREKDFSLNQTLGLKDLRNKMDRLIDFLSDCKLFVSLSVTGIPYFALEKADFSIWEFEGEPIEFLDYILEKEEESKLEEASNKESNVIPFPVEISSGCYQIDLKAIQEGGTGVTSKQALLPFLRQNKFYSLEILCSHIPPWLDVELINNGFNSKVAKINNNTYQVTVTKKCCQEC